MTGTLGLANTAYVQGATYQPDGAIAQRTYYNGVVESRSDNARLQPCSITAAIQGTTLLGLGYLYGGSNCFSPSSDNGNVTSQTIGRPGGNWTQTYTYDGVNRLYSANQTGSSSWSQNFRYDKVGNRWVESYSPWTSLTLETPTAQSWYLNSNRINSWGYDGAGNVTQVSGMARSFTYDAENRMRSATINGLATMYEYDADGRRVTKIQTLGGTAYATTYVYDPFGQLAQEYGLVQPELTNYLTADALGTTRLATRSVVPPSGATGIIDKAYDYLPFGEDFATSYPIYPNFALTGSTVKFAGKERDAETGLDYFGARYYSGAQGRMTSPDAYGVDQHPEDPQSWNLYAYGRNNPLRFVDPTGEYVCGSGVDETMCNNFQKALDAAQDAANKLKETYGEKLTRYTDAQRAIDVYGKQNIDNGVTITSGVNPIDEGEVSPTVGITSKTPDNPLGQKITAAFAANVFSGDYSGNAATVAHEGSHLADASAWVRSGFSPAMNRTRTQTEDTALHVGAYVGMALGMTVGYMSGNSPRYIGAPGWTPRNVDTAIGYGVAPTL